MYYNTQEIQSERNVTEQTPDVNSQFSNDSNITESYSPNGQIKKALNGKEQTQAEPMLLGFESELNETEFQEKKFDLDIPLTEDEDLLSNHILKILDKFNANVYIKSGITMKFLHFTVNNENCRDIYEYLEKLLGIIEKVTNALKFELESIANETIETEALFSIPESNACEAINSKLLFSIPESNTNKSIETEQLFSRTDLNKIESIPTEFHTINIVQTEPLFSSTGSNTDKQIFSTIQSNAVESMQTEQVFLTTDSNTSKPIQIESLSPATKFKDVDLDIPLTADEEQRVYKENLMKLLVDKFSATACVKNGIVVKFLHITVTANVFHSFDIQFYLERFFGMDFNSDNSTKFYFVYPIIEKMSHLDNPSSLYETYLSLLAKKKKKEKESEIKLIRQQLNAFYCLHCKDFTNKTLDSINVLYDLYMAKNLLVSREFDKIASSAYNYVFNSTTKETLDNIIDVFNSKKYNNYEKLEQLPKLPPNYQKHLHLPKIFATETGKLKRSEIFTNDDEKLKRLWKKQIRKTKRNIKHKKLVEYANELLKATNNPVHKNELNKSIRLYELSSTERSSKNLSKRSIKRIKSVGYKLKIPYVTFP